MSIYQAYMAIGAALAAIVFLNNWLLARRVPGVWVEGAFVNQRGVCQDTTSVYLDGRKLETFMQKRERPKSLVELHEFVGTWGEIPLEIMKDEFGVKV